MSTFEIEHGSVNHLPKNPVNHKTWTTAFSAWLTQGLSTIEHASTITILESGQCRPMRIHSKLTRFEYKVWQGGWMDEWMDAPSGAICLWVRENDVPLSDDVLLCREPETKMCEVE